jgi:inosine-uridine nucleoside N-ribohydrolase
MVKLILDTDIGSDIDDAVCLAYLLAHPQCELLGVTTVSGEPTERAKLVSALCVEAGKTVPIYPGIDRPFLVAQKQGHSPQSSMLERWQHQKDFPQAQAIEFLRHTIRANPGEVTLLAIGPMTNIATLFAIDPEIPLLLKQFVMMIGVFTNQLADVGPLEWNAICDSHACAMVYNAPAKVHRSIGLDVTMQVQMDAPQVRQRFQKGLLRPVLDFAEVWFRERPVITFHDPLAAATIFNGEICTFTRGTVETELLSSRTMGMTHWTAGPNGKHEVALSVDKEQFFAEYFNIVAP